MPCASRWPRSSSRAFFPGRLPVQVAALDFAAQPGFLASFFGGVVLLPRLYEPMHDSMMVFFLRGRGRPAGLQLLDDPAVGFFAVSTLGVVLWSFLVSVVILHHPSISG